MLSLHSFISIEVMLSVLIPFIYIQILHVEGSSAYSTSELEKKLNKLQFEIESLKVTNENLANDISIADVACNETISNLNKYQSAIALELGKHNPTAKKLLEKIQNEELVQSEMEGKLIKLYEQLEMLGLLYEITYEDLVIIHREEDNATHRTCGRFIENLENGDFDKNGIRVRSLKKNKPDPFQAIFLNYKVNLADLESTELKAKSAGLLLKQKYAMELCNLRVLDLHHLVNNTEHILKYSTDMLDIITVELNTSQVLTKSLTIEFEFGEILINMVQEQILHFQNKKQIHTMVTKMQSTNH